MKTAFNSWDKQCGTLFFTGTLQPLFFEMDEGFPSAVSFQQDGFDLQDTRDVLEEDSASPFRAEAPVGPPGEQRAQGSSVEGGHSRGPWFQCPWCCSWAFLVFVGKDPLASPSWRREDLSPA